MTDWIKHDSSNPPELAPAAIVWAYEEGDYGADEVFAPPQDGNARVDAVPWGRISWYYQPRDEDGTPYISADGLEEWAGYVATDCDIGAFQHQLKPHKGPLDWHQPFLGRVIEAQEAHRHPGDWRESLYRVWRDQGDDNG